MHRPSEIADFDGAVDGNEDVFGLDIAVDDVFAVQVGEGEGHLVDVG